MIEAMFTGLILVFQWPTLGFLILGVVIGMWIGAVPGLGGVLGLILLLPFTFDMEPVNAFALLLGMFAVTSTSDTIASVMLGIPGTAASQATILDGYPLAQKGQAARAFGAAFTVSAFGGVFGALILAISLPIILPVIVAFASPELFMLGVLGLTMVGALSGGSMLKGLTIALLGILLSTVGYADSDPIPRYFFGSDYLIDQLPLIPVVLGLFAIPELMELSIRNVSISRVPQDQGEGGGMREGIRDAFRHWWLATRCAAIGTYIGMLPGLGAAIVDWIAYGHAVQSAKDKSRFGSGDIRGVIAPEAANNATRGGSLLPTVAFGIPGSLGTAILLSVLLIVGLKPGPDMLTTELHITFSMVWTLVIANILAAGLLMIWSRQVARVAFIPGHLVVPGVILFVFMGAWLAGVALGDWISLFVMGVIGFFMKRGGWPRPPLILAMILGGIMETRFQISNIANDGYGWLGRPIVLIILILVTVTILVAIRSYFRDRKSEQRTEGEGSERNPLLSLPFSALLFLVFAAAGLQALQWPLEVRQFPLLAAIPGAMMALATLFLDYREARTGIKSAGMLQTAWTETLKKSLVGPALQFFGYLLVMIALMLVIGQKMVLPLFVFIYLVRWGNYSAKVAGSYALGSWFLLIGFYDRVMSLQWYPSLAYYTVPDWLPDWIPPWLFV